jgi:hypothetical protein
MPTENLLHETPTLIDAVRQNARTERLKSLLQATLVVVTLLGWSGHALSQSAICAEVKIEIKQKVSLERQAFDVALKINNGLTDRAIEALRVTLLVSDLAGNAVAFTTNPNDTSAAFFYRLDTLTGTVALDGSSAVAQSTRAEARWLFIPSSGAASSLPSGKQYRIGASIQYVLAGQAQTVDVEPEIITVRAQPKLKLDYFLQPDIYADDPFTVPVEPSEPATLGVRIRNVGLGAAANLRIDSAQPKIVENRQGLAIAFKLEGGYVNDVPRGTSLQLDFGALGAGTTAMGRWDLTTTLAGRFIEFSAAFTHADALGGALTSLIETLTARFLLHDVVVDLPGRDAVRDFLSSDGGLFVYESDGVDTPVIDVSTNATLTAASGGYRLQHQSASLLTYAKVASPVGANLRISRVARSDGKVLNPQNYWLSKKRNADLSWSYSINVFDSQSTGDYLITATGGVATSIAGRVFDDTSDDGVDQAEPGIGVVRVDLQGTLSAGGTTSAVAYSEASGSFEFVGLQAGTYSVTVGQTPARSDGAPTIGNAGGSAGNSVSGAPQVTNIVIVEGQTATGYRFAKRRASGAGSTDLRVGITPSTVALRAGTTGMLLVTLQNISATSAQATAVRFTVPSWVTMSEAMPTTGTVDLTALSWFVGELAPGQRHQLRLKVSPTAGASPPTTGSIEATALSATTDTNLANNIASATIRLDALQRCTASAALTVEPLLLIRYLQGLRGLELISGLYPIALASEPLAEVLTQNLTNNLAAYDFDGSGSVTALVDGVIYARYALGIRGDALVAGLTLPANLDLAAVVSRLEACQ